MVKGNWTLSIIIGLIGLVSGLMYLGLKIPGVPVGYIFPLSYVFLAKVYEKIIIIAGSAEGLGWLYPIFSLLVGMIYGGFYLNIIWKKKETTTTNAGGE